MREVSYIGYCQQKPRHSGSVPVQTEAFKQGHYTPLVFFFELGLSYEFDWLSLGLKLTKWFQSPFYFQCHSSSCMDLSSLISSAILFEICTIVDSNSILISVINTFGCRTFTSAYHHNRGEVYAQVCGWLQAYALPSYWACVHLLRVHQVRVILDQQIMVLQCCYCLFQFPVVSVVVSFIFSFA